MDVYRPTHILDFNERLFQEIMTLFNVTTEDEEINPRLAIRKKNKKFVSIPKLFDFLSSKLNVSKDKLNKLIEKIDHKNKNKITWTEFLLFMNKESEKREIINDANIYGCGIKRFSEGSRLKPYSNGVPVNYSIDLFLIMPLDSTSIYLMIFENNVVGLTTVEKNLNKKNNDTFLLRKKQVSIGNFNFDKINFNF